jgi:opacity protein-like surface antigen
VQTAPGSNQLNSNKMKLVIVCFVLFFPVASMSQVTVSAGFVMGNRWSETFTAQTAGKGFRVSAEKNILPRLAIGAAVSYVSFDPNKLVNIRYNSYSLLLAYYLNAKKLQPYSGAAIGFNHYYDHTILNIGPGTDIKQVRKKNYGVVSPFMGLKCHFDQQKRTAVFLQVNADFVPVEGIDPIGFVSVTSGFVYRF